MKYVLRLAILGLATTSLINCTDADDPIPAGDDDNTQIERDDGRPLTPPSGDAPASIVRSYLSGRVAGDQLKVTGESISRGVTHVRFEQVVGGLRVHGAYAKAALSSRGELLQVIHRVVPTSKTTKLVPAQAIESDALRTALVEHGYGIEPARVRTRGHVTAFAQTAEMYREPTVERVAYSDETGTLRVGFLVETWSQVGNQLDYTLVGGDGRVVSTELRTNNESYRVFVEDPGNSAAQTVESGNGWLNAGTHTTHHIQGPNARAYLDTDNNNVADSKTTTLAADVIDGNFLAVANLSQSPATVTNRAVAVQTLFYLNNIMHDRLEAVGFDNANGNFEGDDPVNAEAQDGGGLDNANMATPADGSSPRMQMYLWSGSTPAGLVTVNGVDYGFYPSSFGPALTAAGLTGALAVVNDNDDTAGTTSDGCQSSPAGSLTGKIALVDRGNCDFTVKVLNAQKAGAVGAIIINNVAGPAFGPGGTNRRVSILSGMVSQADGGTLKGFAGESANLHPNSAEPLRLDGDLDSDIVFHEYGHGLTWRMIGSMSGKFAGAIGEGASDVLAFLHNGDGAIGEYSSGDPAGIRRHDYASYPPELTYSDWTANQVHTDGEIYAAAMWAVYENYGFNNGPALLADFVDGMNYTQASPRPEHMRDGMIASLTPGVTPTPATPHFCDIWRGFAKRGIGVGATVTTSKGKTVISESFKVPDGCPAP